MDYENYEEKCEKIKAENETCLALFKEELRKKDLSEKTIERHCQSVEFYINVYLNYEEPQTMDVGCYELYGFLGEFFIRKCLWSTPATIKSTAASIKKFYKCMLDHGKIDKESYQTLCESIKTDMEDWQNTCAIYNDPNQENPFMPW